MGYKLTYRDFLIRNTASVANLLCGAIQTAVDMNDDAYAERYLEQQLKDAILLCKAKPNFDVVGHPTEEEE